MPLPRRIPFTVLASLLFTFSTLEFASAQCAIKPIKPIPPLGCKDLTPQCVSDSNGQSYWTWICVPDSGAVDTNKDRTRPAPAPELVSPKQANENTVQAAPVSPVEAPQTHVPISEDSKPAVETLRMIAKRIEECQKILFYEGNWGRKADEIGRYYYQTPANVVWDVVAGNSVRAPYLGYIEFTIKLDHWVPESAERRFRQSGASMAYLTIAGGFPLYFRYEYDLGSNGLQLIKALQRHTKTTGEWHDQNIDNPESNCWNVAARDTLPKASTLPDKRGQEVPQASALPDKSAQGVPQDDAQAAYWYRKAAEQGDAVAQNNLGGLYAHGQGVPQDYAQAAVWYRKAAEQGYAVAQYALGVFYSHGQGVPHDDAQAAFWWRKAAEQNYATAQFYLGLSHSIGKGVPQDKTEAYFWITLAASSQKIEGVKQENVLTSINDVTADLNADLKPSDLSRVLSRVQERARKWFEDHPAKPQ